MSKENNELKENTPITEEELNNVSGGKLSISDEERKARALGSCDIHTDIPHDCPNKPCASCSHFKPISFETVLEN